jgi:hypothetical protein
LTTPPRIEILFGLRSGGELEATTIAEVILLERRESLRLLSAAVPVFLTSMVSAICGLPSLETVSALCAEKNWAGWRCVVEDEE